MGCNNSKPDVELSKPEPIDTLLGVYNDIKQSARGNIWIPIFAYKQYPLYELERHKDLISWSACSRYQALPCWFITKYKSRIDFDALSSNKHLTDDIIDTFIDDLKFYVLIRNESFSQKLAEKLLSQDNITTHKKRQLLEAYKFNELLLEPLLRYKYCSEYKDSVSQYQELSETFMIKHDSSLNWNLINKYQCISVDFIEAHPNLVRWDELSYNKNLTYDIVVKYRGKLKNTEEVERICLKKIKHD